MEKRVPARLTAAEGRKFAFTVGLAFIVLAGILWWRDKGILAVGAGGLGGVLLLAGILAPRQLGPVQRGWMAFALLISRVTTPIFMGIVYFLVITPIGLLRRTFGNSPVLPRRSASNTYWHPAERPASDLNRQF